MSKCINQKQSIIFPGNIFQFLSNLRRLTLIKINKMKYKVKLKIKPLLNGSNPRPPTLKLSHIK